MADTSWGELRRRAEERVGLSPTSRWDAEDTSRVLYELEVHEVELHLQHDEHHRARVALELERDEYRALFEDAPIAYVEMDQQSYVHRANRAAAELFSLPEGPLTAGQGAGAAGPPLVAALSPESADAVQRHLRQAVASGERTSCVLDLAVLGQPSLRVKLDTDPVVIRGMRLCRTAVTELPPVSGEPAPCTVWVVDDEPSVRAAIGRMVRRLGYRVVVKAAGQEVLEALARDEAPMDVLVTDVSMPGMSGVELAARVRRRWPGTHVLFVSGNVGDERPGPGDRLLSKPFSPRALGREIEALLAGR